MKFERLALGSSACFRKPRDRREKSESLSETAQKTFYRGSPISVSCGRVVDSCLSHAFF